MVWSISFFTTSCQDLTLHDLPPLSCPYSYSQESFQDCKRSDYHLIHVHVIQSWEDYNSFSSYIKSSHQKILNSLCLTEECTLSSSSMLGNVFNMDHNPCTDPSIRNAEQSQPTRFCLLGVQLNEGVHIDQSCTRVPRHTCVLRHSNPDVWSHSLYCSSHQQDYLGRGRLPNQKKPTAEVLRMGALLANEEAVF